MSETPSAQRLTEVPTSAARTLLFEQLKERNTSDVQIIIRRTSESHLCVTVIGAPRGLAET